MTLAITRIYRVHLYSRINGYSRMVWSGDVDDLGIIREEFCPLPRPKVGTSRLYCQASARARDLLLTIISNTPRPTDGKVNGVFAYTID